MFEIMKKSIGILKSKGPKEFLNRTVQYLLWRFEFIYAKIRPYLPSKGRLVYNSVEVGDKKHFDRFFPTYQDDPNKEDGIVSCHERYTEEGDSVVIIGGGDGVSAVHAARRVGKTGSVSIFEGGEESADNIQNVINEEGFSDICEVKHAIVGEEIDVYGGGTSSAAVISPEDLPECDILELDCEGSEVDVLRKLTIQPRFIFVELHPWFYSEQNEKPIELLQDLGYELTCKLGHRGIELSGDIEKLLEKSLQKESGVRKLSSGAQGPIVVAAANYRTN